MQKLTYEGATGLLRAYVAEMIQAEVNDIKEYLKRDVLKLTRAQRRDELATVKSWCEDKEAVQDMSFTQLVNYIVDREGSDEDLADIIIDALVSKYEEPSDVSS